GAGALVPAEALADKLPPLPAAEERSLQRQNDEAGPEPHGTSAVETGPQPEAGRKHSRNPIKANGPVSLNNLAEATGQEASTPGKRKQSGMKRSGEAGRDRGGRPAVPTPTALRSQNLDGEIKV